MGHIRCSGTSLVFHQAMTLAALSEWQTGVWSVDLCHLLQLPLSLIFSRMSHFIDKETEAQIPHLPGGWYRSSSFYSSSVHPFLRAKAVVCKPEPWAAVGAHAEDPGGLRCEDCELFAETSG